MEREIWVKSIRPLRRARPPATPVNGEEFLRMGHALPSSSLGPQPQHSLRCDSCVRV